MLSGSTTTLALGLAAVAALVYFVGIDSTASAARSTGRSIRTNANRSLAVGAGGAALGLQFGNDLISAILAEPGFALTAVAGIMGALGTEGVLGDITGLQFVLIGFVTFLTVYALFGGDD